ncbi:MAG: hypothetical protein DHS80DRAFT_22237 [Piptocephalis tieghemiana]|nr:MAG: hypothetical protein DHS80DRAFT_22237 [Piptocephalis tieghemiana]
MNVQDLFSVKGKVALVTGGSRGIGLMIAEGLVRSGAKVYISSRSKDVCDTEAKRLSEMGPGECISVPADLAKEEDLKGLMKKISEQETALHILVNNAGANWGAGLDEYPDGAFDKVLTLNVRRVFSLTQAALPLLRKAASAEDPARVINIGSVDGVRVPALETYAYSSSKSAVHQLSRHLASRLGPEYITVNAVAPGPFRSKMMNATLDRHEKEIVSSIPLKRIGMPEDMAAITLYLSSKAGRYVTGTIIPVDGGSLVRANL